MATKAVRKREEVVEYPVRDAMKLWRDKEYSNDFTNHPEYDREYAPKNADGSPKNPKEWTDDEIDEYAYQRGRRTFGANYATSGFKSEQDALKGYDNGIFELFTADSKKAWDEVNAKPATKTRKTTASRNAAIEQPNATLDPNRIAEDADAEVSSEISKDIRKETRRAARDSRKISRTISKDGKISVNPMQMPEENQANVELNADKIASEADAEAEASLQNAINEETRRINNEPFPLNANTKKDIQPINAQNDTPTQIEQQESTPISKAAQLASFSERLSRKPFSIDAYSGPMFDLKSTELPNPNDARTAEQIRTDNLTSQTVSKNAEMQQQASESAQTASTAPQTPAEPVAQQDSPIDWRSQILALQERERKLEEDDETRQRREASMRRLTSVADALASVANMYGVSKGGVSMNEPGNYRYISQQIAQNQKLRNANLNTARQQTLNALLGASRAQSQANRDETNKFVAQLRADRDAQRLEYQFQKLGLDRDKLDERIREYDLAFDQKNEAEKNKLRIAELRAMAQRDSAAIKAEGSKTVAQTNAEAKKTASESKNAEKQRKEDNTNVLVGIASTDDWTGTIAKIAREIGVSPEALGNKYVESINDRVKVLESIAARYPEWAKSKGYKTAPSGSAPASTTTSDDGVDKSGSKKVYDEFN